MPLRRVQAYGIPGISRVSDNQHIVLCLIAAYHGAMRHLDPSNAVRSICLWCNHEFLPRNSGGSPQRFCCAGHRRAFHIAAHQFVLAELSAGRVSVNAVKKLARLTGSLPADDGLSGSHIS
jgi:hypothetical protein